MNRFVPVNEPLLGELEMEYVREAIETGWISSAGSFIQRFEDGWADYCGRKHGVAVFNGTVALELAVAVLELPERSEVILPAFTIISCLEAVVRNGLRPVFVDCDPDTYCMDVADLERKIGPDTSAIMPVHIYGHPCDMHSILSLAHRHSLRVIEDAAEAHGSECLMGETWRRCGAFGDVSTFSFYANKNITTGEGGMVLTDSPELAEALRERRNLCFGRDERFKYRGRGWNFRMTNVQAALGCAQMERIDGFLGRKLEMAAAYDRGLEGLPLTRPTIRPWAKTSVWMYAVVLDDSLPFGAIEFAERLRGEGVDTRPFFRGLHDQPDLPIDLGDQGDFPVTDRIYQRGQYLPSGQAITDEQIAHVVGAVRRVLT